MLVLVVHCIVLHERDFDIDNQVVVHPASIFVNFSVFFFYQILVFNNVHYQILTSNNILDSEGQIRIIDEQSSTITGQISNHRIIVTIL